MTVFLFKATFETLISTKISSVMNTLQKIDGCIACYFSRMRTIGYCVQGAHFTTEKISVYGNRAGDRWISRPALNSQSYRGSSEHVEVLYHQYSENSTKECLGRFINFKYKVISSKTSSAE